MEEKLTKCSTSFRKSHGNQYSLLVMFERGKRGTRKGKYVSALFMNFSKSFDTIKQSFARQTKSILIFNSSSEPYAYLFNKEQKTES